MANYHGTVHFTSSDPLATLPADTVFTSAYEGNKKLVGQVVWRTVVCSGSR